MENNNMQLDRETFGVAAEVFDGFWIIATQHHPGHHHQMPEINNRCLIFKLNDTDGPVLFVVNAVDPEVIPEVRRLEAQTGLDVRYIASPGGGHHLQLRRWHDEFARAKVLVCPVRVPKTNNGKTLMTLPRVHAMDLHDPLPQFRGQLDAVIFHGILSVKDKPNPFEGGSSSFFGMVKRMLSAFPPSMPGDELWLHHVASGTVIGGENLGWYYTKEAAQKLPMMMKMMLKPGEVAIQTQTMKIADIKTVQECWKKILAWDCNTLMTYHDPPTIAYVGDARAALEAAVRKAGQC
jgi:hypothetical protein